MPSQSHQLKNCPPENLILKVLLHLYKAVKLCPVVREVPPGVTAVEEENRAVERLARQIEATTDQLRLLSAARQKETDFQLTLARMLELEKDKITKE